MTENRFLRGRGAFVNMADAEYSAMSIETSPLGSIGAPRLVIGPRSPKVLRSGLVNKRLTK